MSMLPFAVALVSFASAAVAADKPFDVETLANLDRLSGQKLSPDGSALVWQLRQTDYAANKGMNSIWTMPVAGGTPQRRTANELGANSPAWSADGSSVYFLAAKDGVSQLWQQSRGGTAQQVTHFPIDVDSYKLSPDGKHLLASMSVFTDCTDLACTKQKLDAEAKDKATGVLYDRLFVRHWDTWSDGRRNQLFVADLGSDGQFGKARLLTKGIDGDVPSKPFGDDSEYNWSPDGKTVYFNVRIAGKTEAWSTNFDVYSVPADGSAEPKNLTAANLAWDGSPLPSADGKTLYYLAMRRPGFEADRFDIKAMDLATGQVRSVAPDWDRSASALTESVDGRTLYTATDDEGQHPLFGIDVASGKVTKLLLEGAVSGIAVAKDKIVVGIQTLQHPTDLWAMKANGGKLHQLTHVNADKLADVTVGASEFFTFKGYNDEQVQGYVVKPAGFTAGTKYPVAFIIHGGPQGAMTNSWSYRWNPQTYAGQGFAVVTVNFHGSTGYGQAFTDSISGDWGGKPLVDLQKGWAAALAKYDWLDSDRACALGASYGGYMINWIAAKWNQPWKCLVNHDGVFDTRSMGLATEELWFSEWENGGTVYDQPEAYEKFNPRNHIQDWRVPMLVVQGEKDFRIPTVQGLSAFTALQRRGIESELLVFPDENHWVLKPQNSVFWHHTVNAWLKRWTAK
ncbi:MAG: S9 family peptidase [Dokdonella sp.]